jgi:hypothetical protein
MNLKPDVRATIIEATITALNAIRVILIPSNFFMVHSPLRLVWFMLFCFHKGCPRFVSHHDLLEVDEDSEIHDDIPDTDHLRSRIRGS